jgi:hypothetical protein
MFHWCLDEQIALMSSLPVIGILFNKIHKWYHKASHHKCHEPGCNVNHLSHQIEEVLLPNPTDHNVISVEEVDHLFGSLATIILMYDRKLLGTKEFPPHTEFVWFMKQEPNGIILNLSARWKNKFFVWNGNDWKSELEEEKKESFSFGDIVDIIRDFVTNEEVQQIMLCHQPTETFVKAKRLLKQIDDHENTGSSS